MWTLCDRGAFFSNKVDVTEYDGKIKIHIRRFCKSQKDEWKATAKGIALDLSEWDKLNEQFAAIDLEVSRLRRDYEQDQSILGGGIKRDLETAYGNNYAWMYSAVIF